MKNENRFCVYLHKDQDGVVRYVGKGTGDRPYQHNKARRSKEWFNFFENTPPIVEIVKTDLNNKDAVDLELKMYDLYKETLLNVNPPSDIKEMNFDHFNEYFYLCTTSPTGLRWKKQHKNSKKRKDDIAGSLLNKGRKKYWQIQFKKSNYKVHRIVYLLHKGKIDDTLVVDHLDGNGLNNKIENLRLVSLLENSKNTKVCFDSKTGEKYLLKCKTGFKVCISTLKISKVFGVKRYKGEALALEAAREYKKYILDSIYEKE